MSTYGKRLVRKLKSIAAAAAAVKKLKAILKKKIISKKQNEATSSYLTQRSGFLLWFERATRKVYPSDLDCFIYTMSS